MPYIEQRSLWISFKQVIINHHMCIVVFFLKLNRMLKKHLSIVFHLEKINKSGDGTYPSPLTETLE